MDRRNFFTLAGATGLALTASAGSAQAQGGMMDRGMGHASLQRVSKSFAGTSLDRSIVQIAMGGGGNPAADDEWDWICGPWYAWIHWPFKNSDWQDATEVFGRRFASLPLSRMIDVATRKFGDNVSLRVSRGQLQVSSR